MGYNNIISNIQVLMECQMRQRPHSVLLLAEIDFVSREVLHTSQ